MLRLSRRIPGLLICLLFLMACTPITEAPVTTPQPEISTPESLSSQDIPINPQNCLETFDPNTDYFPEKVEAQYSTQWQVSYHGSYKVIDMSLTPDPAGKHETYLLVQCGAPIPEEFMVAPDTYVYEIPMTRIIDGGGGILGALEMLDVTDTLVAWRADSVTGIEYLPKLHERDQAGEIGDIGPYGSSWEATVEFEPDLYTAYEGEEEQLSLRALDIPYVHYEPFVESPLGSAEQLKFVSLFFNKEGLANDLFAPIVEEYLALRELAQAQEQKPSVLLGNISQSGVFQTRAAARVESILVNDAGGEPILQEDQMDFAGFHPAVPLEIVIEVGANADYWFNTVYLPTEGTAADFIASNPLNAEFTALQAGHMFHRFARDEDYFRTPAILVNELLADIVSILHPELLPNHTLVHIELVPGVE